MLCSADSQRWARVLWRSLRLSELAGRNNETLVDVAGSPLVLRQTSSRADPTCKRGSLLLALKRQVHKHEVDAGHCHQD